MLTEQLHEFSDYITYNKLQLQDNILTRQHFIQINKYSSFFKIHEIIKRKDNNECIVIALNCSTIMQQEPNVALELDKLFVTATVNNIKPTTFTYTIDPSLNSIIEKQYSQVLADLFPDSPTIVIAQDSQSADVTEINDNNENNAATNTNNSENNITSPLPPTSPAPTTTTKTQKKTKKLKQNATLQAETATTSVLDKPAQRKSARVRKPKQIIQEEAEEEELVPQKKKKKNTTATSTVQNQLEQQVQQLNAAISKLSTEVHLLKSQLSATPVVASAPSQEPNQAPSQAPNQAPNQAPSPAPAAVQLNSMAAMASIGSTVPISTAVQPFNNTLTPAHTQWPQVMPIVIVVPQYDSYGRPIMPKPTFNPYAMNHYY